jgi:hypothetical protein
MQCAGSIEDPNNPNQTKGTTMTEYTKTKVQSTLDRLEELAQDAGDEGSPDIQKVILHAIQEIDEKIVDYETTGPKDW